MSKKKKEVGWNKQIPFKNLAIVFCAFVFIAIILGYKPLSGGRKSSSTITPTTTAIVTPTIAKEKTKLTLLTPSPSMEIGTDKLKTYWTHKNLPGFSFWIPEGWDVQVKEFKQKDTLGFRTQYFPSCHEFCMGIRLTKNDTQLEFIFNYNLDDNLSFCTEEGFFKHLRINNSWFQIDGDLFKYNPKYVYTQNIMFERRISDGHESDSSCTYGTMMSLNIDYQKTKNLLFDGGIGLEHPHLYGNPSGDLLQEVWQIINSIAGVNNF